MCRLCAQLIGMDWDDMEPHSLTVSEAVRFSGIARTRIYVLASQGKLTLRKCGRRTLVSTSELKALLDSLPAADIRLASAKPAADAA